MRSFWKSATGLTGLLALAVTGCSPGSGTAPDAASAAPTTSAAAAPAPTASTAGSSTSYAPYVSATTAYSTDSAGSPTAYNLAFVISDGAGCAPKWGGDRAVDDTAVTNRIRALKKSGAAVRVSFGGASGKELATVCDSASALAEAYGRALDAAGSSLADFDIEGDTLGDSASVARRSQAIELLQKERPDLKVTFTLPVMPDGLDSDGLALLASANQYDVQVSTVNLMTMNYGESYTGDMGDYAVTAATAAHTQLKKVFGLSDAAAWRGMALTSMIGVNDIAGETFTLADAARVRSFAEEKEIAWVSMWSAFRDKQCAQGGSAGGDAATDCSGVAQEAGAFGRALAG
ncbi:hydrolase [Streptomyces sp. GMY01]|uniref:chitinase n=1 Tax=Streptomyces sp. GMY02 TaxID=1333528 RepID=UPI00146C100D|nr:chitinase [Streptomyces sp. GMY02]NMO34313.1 hydrolase [Streptomyces sp. GMY02]